MAVVNKIRTVWSGCLSCHEQSQGRGGAPLPSPTFKFTASRSSSLCPCPHGTHVRAVWCNQCVSTSHTCGVCWLVSSSLWVSKLNRKMFQLLPLFTANTSCSFLDFPPPFSTGWSLCSPAPHGVNCSAFPTCLFPSKQKQLLVWPQQKEVPVCVVIALC